MHQESLASNKIQQKLHSILNDANQTKNFIESRILNSKWVWKMSKEMGYEHDNLLFRSEICWLSQGKILARAVN